MDMGSSSVHVKSKPNVKNLEDTRKIAKNESKLSRFLIQQANVRSKLLFTSKISILFARKEAEELNNSANEDSR
jgi:hypothetical protein